MSLKDSDILFANENIIEKMFIKIKESFIKMDYEFSFEELFFFFLKIEFHEPDLEE